MDIEANRKRIATGIIRVTEAASGDESITYVYAVKPELKHSVEKILNAGSSDKSYIARHLCLAGILEAIDSYV